MRMPRFPRLPVAAVLLAAGTLSAQPLTPEEGGRVLPPPVHDHTFHAPEGLDAQLQPFVSGLFDRFDSRPGAGPAVALTSEFTAASTAIPWGMTQRLVWGGFIDEALKDRGLDASGEDHTAGLAWVNAAQVSFGIRPGRTPRGHWTGHVRASSALRLGVGFHRDLYTLLFYGNEPLAGRTASLDGGEVRYDRTQQLEAGVSFRRPVGERGRLVAGLGLAAVQGIRHDDARFEGAFTTSADGGRLDLVLDGRYERTDSIGRWNEAYGWGASGSAHLRYGTEWGPLGWVEAFAQVEDLARIRWQGPGDRYRADSTWSFDGFSVDELSDLAAGTLSTDPDSLLDFLGVGARATGFSAGLGATVSAGLQGAVRTWRYGLGYRQRLGTAMRPLVWAQVGRSFAGGAVQPRLTLAHGGWGSWQAGAELRLAVVRPSAEGFRPELRVGATDLVGYLAPSAGRGGTAYVQLGARF